MKVGTKVKWTSQSQSYALTKVGTIVAVIPAGRRIQDYLSAEQYAPFTKGAGCGNHRNHESYVVVVLPKKGNAKPKYYWPIVSKLKEVKE